MLTKLPMEWIGVLIGIIVFSGTSSYACDDGRFLGHCQRNELCVCVKNNCYQTTTSEIQKVDPYTTSFSSICSCLYTGTNQAVDCLNTYLYNKLVDNLEFNKTLVLTDETTCRQLLTGERPTLTSTEKHKTTFMTASENTVQNQAATVGKSTTLSSTEKPGSTFITASNGHSFHNQATSDGESTTLSSTETLEATFITSANENNVQNQATSDAMCPCSCEYFDKIEYWSQEANQIKQYNELSQQLAQIKKILKMETKNLTAYLNTKKSVGDKRPSSRATGYVGGVILVLILCCLVLLDILKCSHLKNM